MKKNLFLVAMLGISFFSLSSFTLEESSGTDFTEKTFPKKHLIEEFTGQDCGYCPYGMDCISEFMENDTNFILVLHHAGYKNDHFTVSGSSTISNRMGVSGAPSSTINRKAIKYIDESKQTVSEVVIHPAYLLNVDKSQFDNTTYASLNIENTYDSTTRELKVHIAGEIGKENYSSLNLKLTVLVKESGMIDYQSDYYNCYEGWEEFRHANAVRVFLTNSALGDAITIDSTRHYAADLTITLNDKWVADNCMVVAFLSESYKPVVQAAEKPVVAGTQGGADLKHEGIKAVPVADYYPEINATDGPAAFSGVTNEVMSSSYSQYESYPASGFNYWTIQAANPSRTVKVNYTTSIPFVQIFLFTELSQTTLPDGVYEFNTSEQPGTAYAGFRDDSQFYIGGSQFYFANRSYYNQGYLVPTAQWLIAEGTLTISGNAWEVNGKALNGSDIHISYGMPEGLNDVESKTQKNMKFIENGKLIIRTIDGQIYDITGKRIQ